MAFRCFPLSNKFDLGIGPYRFRERTDSWIVAKIDRPSAASTAISIRESSGIGVVIRPIHTGVDVYPSAIGCNAGKRAAPNACIDSRRYGSLSLALCDSAPLSRRAIFNGSFFRFFRLDSLSFRQRHEMLD